MTNALVLSRPFGQSLLPIARALFFTSWNNENVKQTKVIERYLAVGLEVTAEKKQPCLSVSEKPKGQIEHH